jgi:acetyl esterase/lipase
MADGKETESSMLCYAPFPGRKSRFETYDRYDFVVAARPCFVVVPFQAAPGRPWIWRTEFFGHEPQTDLALLARGFHAAYIDMENRYGDPVAMQWMDAFYTGLTRDYGLAPKVVLEGFSQPIAGLDQGFQLFVDMFYRDERPATRRPAVIFMHDWAGGVQPRLAGERQCSYLALTENAFGVVLYYRQPADARFPAALQDLKCCVRWLRSVADRYAIDPDRIVVMGSSAGTQWTQLAAATNGTKDYEGSGGYEGFPSDVNGIVTIAAICDFVNDFGRKEIGRAIMGGNVDEMPERFKEASPLHRLRAGMPPVLMIHGEKDTDCPLASAQAALRRYRELGVPAELIVRPGCGHGATGNGVTLYDNLEAVRQFIRRKG